MEETNDGITFADIFRTIKSKLVAIICVALVLAIIAAAVGAFITPNKKYGTELSFYVSDAKLDTRLLELVSSQSFAEKLLLDENGLTGDKTSEAYAAALEAKQNYEKALTERLEVLRDVKVLPTLINNAKAKSEEMKGAYDSVSAILAAYLAAFPTDGTAENLIDKAKVAEYENQLKVLQEEHKTASDNYSEVLASYQNALERQLQIETSLSTLRAEADSTANALLAAWRADGSVKSSMSVIANSIEYSYSDNSENSFINVKIEIPNDEALAKKVSDKMLIELPRFVVNNVTDDDSATIPKCYVSSTFNEVNELESFGKIKAAVIFGAIAAAGGFVLMCIFVVVADVVNNGSSAAKKAEETDEPKEKKE